MMRRKNSHEEEKEQLWRGKNSNEKEKRKPREGDRTARARERGITRSREV